MCNFQKCGLHLRNFLPVNMQVGEFALWYLSIVLSLQTHPFQVPKSVYNRDSLYSLALNSRKYLEGIKQADCWLFESQRRKETTMKKLQIQQRIEPWPKVIYSPIMAMGFSAMFTFYLQIIPQGKHCQCFIAVMGVVDYLGPSLQLESQRLIYKVVIQKLRREVSQVEQYTIIHNFSYKLIFLNQKKIKKYIYIKAFYAFFQCGRHR